MTETEGPHVHPDPGTLADHAEGLLPSAQTAEVARHLLTCAACRDTRDALSEVSTLLTAYADPGPMPADVAARLDAALAEGGPLEPAADDEGAPQGTSADEGLAAATVVPADTPTGRPSRTPFGSKVLQIAAVVVLIAAVGGIAVSALLSHTGSGGAESAGSAQDRSARSNGSAAGAAATLRSATGTAYSLGNVGKLAQTLVSGEKTAAGAVPSAASGAPAPNFSARLPADARVLSDSPQALDDCLKRLLGASERPLAIDLGTWSGTPATMVVLPGADDPTQLDVYVLRASCPPGSFLAFVRVPR